MAEAQGPEEFAQAAALLTRAAETAPAVGGCQAADPPATGPEQEPEQDGARADGPVVGVELLGDIRRFIQRFVVLPSDEAADMLALWVAHTHAFEAAWATPYLRITSAAPSSGKTLLLEVLASVVRNGWHAINPSVAVLYRKIDRAAPTLLLDEMDNYPLDDRRDALAVLNAGYKRGARVDRCKENGDLESFNAFCPRPTPGWTPAPSSTPCSRARSRSDSWPG